MTNAHLATSYVTNSVKPLPQPAPDVINDIRATKFDASKLFRLDGQVAVITGSGRGLGRAIAECYASVGATIILWDYENPTEAAKEISEKYGVKCLSVGCDVSNSKNVEEAIDKISQQFNGKIDIFVANAGVAWQSGSILNSENQDDKNWHRVMNVDLNGVYYCCKNIGKVFKANNSGSLIITASMSGSIVNVPNYQAPYNAAKSACIHLAKSLAVEFTEFNARVNSISPGYLDTGLSDFLPVEIRSRWWSLIPMGREAFPEEIASAYLYLASNASTYTTGTNLVVDGGYSVV
ncbi:Peroxisomal 2,4-dienoyl-CoA reductase [Komagataella phaffii CBS 7435]|uniref:Uncharacterized protein n=2 Tax=Komagataella phaffii TaxID=460519 RepID=C4R8U2_KOMPG|nr:uncharacterized protein PAS_chr4_0988 [Komagataella phaffii GS115]AOA64372.1 GQ67_05136T0 [Komagataella phaffii]CAH2450577.1 Peroxisomal 2,4-dienoyl-CoA reductase [Komagataella phaffii CBS 7435]AOA70303.1 GQ68_05118T0 [Komagataella phaffii GS115]CAY72017.1 hypothetical protein PAS_chr4_0988 [Komagataella phaffii GS115]CCA40381.1 Peroxisomal 2,4-dienoyl-CoA reductase [Komagataella phaffii CBS 7435]